MATDARQIANWFIRRAQEDGRELSIMTILKLVYVAHGWHLEIKDAPLFPNRIEAWKFGPVVPDVYRAFRDQGVTVRNPVGRAPDGQIDEAQQKLLEQVWTIYGNLSAFRLSEITHVPGGPWDVATRMAGHYARIPDDLIKGHYQELRRRARAAASQAAQADKAAQHG